MATFGERILDRAFGHPQGRLGRLGGAMMARANAATERRMVELAGISDGDIVLAIGCGPGVGVEYAARVAGMVIAVDPSETMLAACRRRCENLYDRGAVRLSRGTAQDTRQPDASADIVMTVNNVQFWPDWRAGFNELHRVTRPGGSLLISSHEKWLPGGLTALAAAVKRAGFDDIRTWTWEPPGRGATTAVQLHARQ
ncbi:class I SAM-dependent methyltransferase [Arthrobacter castelli]|uniref:class I SAM-dependent methyltransferase n=1 Tax=Arthrobacter castelli TaxID=271431 RepID=UPI000424F84B|nr:class I SAM-dependent methyltransferase [Arthrobacter castelli]